MEFDLFSLIRTQFELLNNEGESEYAYRLSLALNGSTGSEILLATYRELCHPPETLTNERSIEIGNIREQVKCVLKQAGWAIPDFDRQPDK